MQCGECRRGPCRAGGGRWGYGVRVCYDSSEGRVRWLPVQYKGSGRLGALAAGPCGWSGDHGWQVTCSRRAGVSEAMFGGSRQVAAAGAGCGSATGRRGLTLGQQGGQGLGCIGLQPSPWWG